MRGAAATADTLMQARAIEATGPFLLQSRAGRPHDLQTDEFSVSTAVSSCPTRLKGCPR